MAASFWREAFFVTLACIYPVETLYGYFVFCGLFGLETESLHGTVPSTLFIIFSFLLAYKIYLYLELQAIRNWSTMHVFPSTAESSVVRLHTDINPFIVESLIAESATKTQICEHCRTYKPPRAHHCRRCHCCFLKHDHHCYFLDVCIGFHNQKLFIHFLVVSIISAVIAVVFLVLVATEPSDELEATQIHFIVGAVLFSIELLALVTTLAFQIFLISFNETAIEFSALNAYLRGDNSYIYVFQEGPIREFSEAKDRRILNPYNLGVRANWKAVFGNNPLEWVLPLPTMHGNGTAFKTHDQWMPKRMDYNE